MGEVEVMQEDQAAALAALEQAAGMEGGEAPAQEAPGIDPAEQWAMFPAMVGSALAMALPETRAVYSEANCRAWGAAMVPVAEKYGWDAGALMGPELGLLAASLPLVLGTVNAVKAKRAELAAVQDQGRQQGPVAGVNQAGARIIDPAPGSMQAPGASTVSFGAQQ